jgi:hypothetical protein
MILLVFACGIIVGIGLAGMVACLIGLCQSAKRADLCRMPDASQEAFEPTEVIKQKAPL